MLNTTADTLQGKQSQDAALVAGHTSDDPHQVIIDDVIKSVNTHLQQLIHRLVDSANHVLQQKASDTFTGKQRVDYQSCIRIMSTPEGDIQRRFFDKLDQALQPRECDLYSEDDSTLVDQDEMEEMIAITTMHSKAMKLFGDDVIQMEARLEYLELLSQNMFDKESIDPQHLCEMFQNTIDELDIAMAAKMLMYKIFDREVCTKLGAMYNDINRLLVGHDIMPEIIMSSMKADDIEQAQQQVTTSVATYYDPAEKVHTDFIPRTKEEISKIVNDFMSGEATITENEIELPESFLRKPTQDDITGKNCYERKEVLKALSSLQRKIKQMDMSAEMLSSEQIKQEMLSGFDNDGDASKHVNLLHERSMDFVGMMFNAIADDSTVSEVMTSLIYQLQIPVMKLAMLDNSLFEDEDHPARLTVDHLTRIGRGIDSRDDPLYKNLDKIVDTILDQFDADISAFQIAADQLQIIVDKEEAHLLETERRQQMEILKARAKKIVVAQVKLLTRKIQIPQQLRSLALKLLPTLLLKIYIKDGRGSQQWRDTIEVYRQLLSCMHPVSGIKQYRFIEHNLVSICNAVSERLVAAGQAGAEIKSQADALRNYLAAVLDKHASLAQQPEEEAVSEELSLEELSLEETNKNTDEEFADDEFERVQQQAEQEAELSQQKLALIADRLKRGAWYEVYNGEDRPVRRLKLAVVLEDTAELIFVDRKGNTVIEKDAEEFALELEDQRSSMIADHSTFDNALGNVINALAA